MKSSRHLSPAPSRKGFTLVELLVALVVASVVLTAVATLAYAMSAANDVAGDTTEKQAQVRCATLRISELIRQCRLICSVSGEDVAVWRSDDNADGKININELVYIEWGSCRDRLGICEFPVSNGLPIALSSIQALSTNWWLAYSYNVSYVRLIPQCANVDFSSDTLPPYSKLATISFELLENNTVRQYQVSAALRGWAGYLLDDSGEIVNSDDDQR